MNETERTVEASKGDRTVIALTHAERARLRDLFARIATGKALPDRPKDDYHSPKDLPEKLRQRAQHWQTKFNENEELKRTRVNQIDPDFGEIFSHKPDVRETIELLEWVAKWRASRPTAPQVTMVATEQAEQRDSEKEKKKLVGVATVALLRSAEPFRPPVSEQKHAAKNANILLDWQSDSDYVPETGIVGITKRRLTKKMRKTYTDPSGRTRRWTRWDARTQF